MTQHMDSTGRKWEIVEDAGTGLPTFMPVRDEYRSAPGYEEKFAELDDTLRRHRQAIMQLEQRITAMELGGEPVPVIRQATPTPTPAVVYMINSSIPVLEHTMDVLAGHKELFEKVKLAREFQTAAGYFKRQLEYLRRARHNPPVGADRLRTRLDDHCVAAGSLAQALDKVDKKVHGAEHTKLADAIATEIKQPLERIAAESRAS